MLWRNKILVFIEELRIVMILLLKTFRWCESSCPIAFAEDKAFLFEYIVERMEIMTENQLTNLINYMVDMMDWIYCFFIDTLCIMNNAVHPVYLLFHTTHTHTHTISLCGW